MAELKRIGAVENANGSVSVRHPDGSTGTLSKGAPVYQGDLIETGSDGRVGVVFVDKSSFSLGPKGRMSMDEMVYDPANPEAGHSTVGALGGAFSFVSGQIAKAHPDAMQIKTPVFTIGVRGTSGAGKAAPEGSENTITLLRDGSGALGEIVISNAAGSVRLNSETHTIQVTSYIQPPPAPRHVSAADIQREYGHALESQPNRPADPPAHPPAQNNDGGQQGGDGGSEKPAEEAGEALPETAEQTVQFVSANLNQLLVQVKEPVGDEIGAILRDIRNFVVVNANNVQKDIQTLVNDVSVVETPVDDDDDVVTVVADDANDVYVVESLAANGSNRSIDDNDGGYDFLQLAADNISFARLLRGADKVGDNLVLKLATYPVGGTSTITLLDQFAGGAVEELIDDSGDPDHYLTLDGVADEYSNLLIVDGNTYALDGDDIMVWSSTNAISANFTFNGGDGSDEAVFWNWNAGTHGGLKFYSGGDVKDKTTGTITVAAIGNVEHVTGTTGADEFIFTSTMTSARGFGGADIFDATSVVSTFTRVEYDDREAGISVTTSSATQKVVTHGGDVDTLKSIDAVIGTDFDDTYLDTFNGSDDWFAPGAGNDGFTAGGGTDTVSYDDGPSGGGGLDIDFDTGTLQATNGISGSFLDPWGGTDTVTGVEKVRGTDNIDHMRIVSGTGELYGDGGDDIMAVNGGGGSLYGEEGDDDLTGGGVGSTLVGGEGDDTLTGGGSADTFLFKLSKTYSASEYPAGSLDRISLLGMDDVLNFDTTNDSFVLADSDFGLGSLVSGTNFFTSWTAANLVTSGAGLVLSDYGSGVSVWYCEDLGDTHSTSYQIADVAGVTAANLATQVSLG